MHAWKQLLSSITSACTLIIYDAFANPAMIAYVHIFLVRCKFANHEFVSCLIKQRTSAEAARIATVVASQAGRVDVGAVGAIRCTCEFLRYTCTAQKCRDAARRYLYSQ